MRCIMLVALTALALAGPALADDDATTSADTDSQRQTFNTEVCQIDGLKVAQCDCAWQFIVRKLPPKDLKLAMLLTASSSDNAEVARKADEQLDKNSATDKRRDAVSSEISALIIEAEDACGKK